MILQQIVLVNFQMSVFCLKNDFISYLKYSTSQCAFLPELSTASAFLKCRVDDEGNDIQDLLRTPESIYDQAR